MKRSLAVGVLAILMCTAAHAADVMEFKPVSPESAYRYEGRAPLRHRASEKIPSAPRPASKRAARSVPSTDSLVPLEGESPTAPASPLPPRVPGHSGEMMRIGSDIHVESDQTIEGDVVAISGDVTVDGHVKGDVMAMRGNVSLSSTARVDGDVVCLGGELREDSGAFVGGQRVTALGGRIPRTSRHGERTPLSERLELPLMNHLSRFLRSLIWLLVNLGLLWLLVRIAPGRTTTALGRLRRETAASLGVGLLTWVLLIPSLIALCLVVAILCITIIGIPVALAALFAYFILLAVLMVWGSVVGAAWIGEQLGGRFGPQPMSLMRAGVIGIVLIAGARAAGHLVAIIPFFGFIGGFVRVVTMIVGVFLTTLGAGALLRAEFAAGTVGNWWHGVRAPKNGGTAGPVAASPTSASPAPAPMSGAPAPGASAATVSPWAPPPAAGDLPSGSGTPPAGPGLPPDPGGSPPAPIGG